MSDMQIAHGRINRFVTQDSLNDVQTGAFLNEMGGKAMTQRMHRRVRDLKFLAGGNQKPLKRAMRHRHTGIFHAQGELTAMLDAPADIRENQGMMPMKSIIDP